MSIAFPNSQPNYRRKANKMCRKILHCKHSAKIILAHKEVTLRKGEPFSAARNTKTRSLNVFFFFFHFVYWPCRLLSLRKRRHSIAHSRISKWPPSCCSVWMWVKLLYIMFMLSCIFFFLLVAWQTAFFYSVRFVCHFFPIAFVIIFLQFPTLHRQPQL